MTDAQKFSAGVQQYLRNYKKLPKEEQERLAQKHLVEAGIIDVNGEFTDHFAYSREYYRNRKKACKAKVL
jgi:hypothetical protein